jgi:hypothetical protein
MLVIFILVHQGDDSRESDAKTSGGLTLQLLDAMLAMITS